MTSPATPNKTGLAFVLPMMGVVALLLAVVLTTVTLAVRIEPGLVHVPLLIVAVGAAYVMARVTLGTYRIWRSARGSA